MSHFAQVFNGTVTQVIVAEQDVIDSGAFGQGWIQTSYNTRGGVHYAPNSHTPDGEPALRGNYACIGYTYDKTNDVFYAPRPKDINGKPCESWTIDAPSWTWTPPIPYPTDGNLYGWNETTKSWVILTNI